jgi:hypothetical protein
MRPVGIEPTTFGWKDRCSLASFQRPLTTELRALTLQIGRFLRRFREPIERPLTGSAPIPPFRVPTQPRCRKPDSKRRGRARSARAVVGAGHPVPRGGGCRAGSAGLSNASGSPKPHGGITTDHTRICQRQPLTDHCLTLPQFSPAAPFPRSTRRGRAGSVASRGAR